MEETLNATAVLLVKENLLSLEDAIQHQQAAKQFSYRFLNYLVTKTDLCSNDLIQFLASHFGLATIDLDTLSDTDIPQHFIIPALLQHHLIPIRQEEKKLYVALDDPNQCHSFKEIQFQTGCQILPILAHPEKLAARIEKLTREMEHNGLSRFIYSQNLAITDQHLDFNLDSESPIVTFVHRLLSQAIEKQASDMHFEPFAASFRIRYRLDGQLYELTIPPKNVGLRLIARLKIMADLDIAEHRLPQDGRFDFPYVTGVNLDCRVSTCPTIYGEKLVVRFLHKNQDYPSLNHLGMSDCVENACLTALQRPQGLILVTGPTGCGKTITLNAMLRLLNQGDKNICTVEDPVEITQFGLNQVQVNPKIGLHFAQVLRTFLRQDPDVIMIGEIRDHETADMAIKAAQTGHLVLSTLHTNNCAETILRLQDLGLSLHLLLSSLSLILAQRLVRLLCDFCKTEAPPLTFPMTYRAQGCSRCHQGYQGRTAIFEMLPMTDLFKKEILNSPLNLDDLQRREGLLSLRQAGLLKFYQGITSAEEITKRV